MKKGGLKKIGKIANKLMMQDGENWAFCRKTNECGSTAALLCEHTHAHTLNEKCITVSHSDLVLF